MTLGDFLFVVLAVALGVGIGSIPLIVVVLILGDDIKGIYTEANLIRSRLRYINDDMRKRP